MDIRTEIKTLGKPTLALGKAIESLAVFARETNSYSMFTEWSIGNQIIPRPNFFYMEFENIKIIGGLFLFCINGVNLDIALSGFQSYQFATDNEYITEWELSIILNNDKYFNITIFHNNRVKFSFDKENKTFLWKK